MSNPVRLKGTEKLNKQLERLPSTVRGKTMRQALRAGAKLIEREAGRRVPIGTGGLKSALTTIVTTKRTGAQWARIGAAMPDGAHIHLVEFGTKERFTNVISSRSGGINIGAGASRGRMPAQPFLRPAFDSRRAAALVEVSKVLRRAIDRV